LGKPGLAFWVTGSHCTLMRRLNTQWDRSAPRCVFLAISWGRERSSSDLPVYRRCGLAGAVSPALVQNILLYFCLLQASLLHLPRYRGHRETVGITPGACALFSAASIVAWMGGVVALTPTVCSNSPFGSRKRSSPPGGRHRRGYRNRAPGSISRKPVPSRLRAHKGHFYGLHGRKVAITVNHLHPAQACGPFPWRP